MNDIETMVFAGVALPLREKFPGIMVSGEYTPSPASFPAVTVAEIDNSVVRRMATAGRIENASMLTYEVNIYTNRSGYKKLDAKEIMLAVDECLSGMGFVRTMCNPVPNLQDSSIYRLTARYEGYDYPEYDGDDVNHRIYTN